MHDDINLQNPIIYKLVDHEQELQGILDLQLANHKSIVDETTKKSQGFVTVRHNMEQLIAMHKIEPSAIAKYNDEVIAYVIAMTKASKKLIPELMPMFNLFDGLQFKNKALSLYQYMVVGQVCVSENHRGQSVFKKTYHQYKEAFQSSYDFCITEIDVNNTRSLKAHENIGFQTIHTYRDRNEIDWAIVVWDWR
jgi:hypothetical protein